MTREEAIKTWLPIISMGIDNMPELKEAFDMAIKALEQEPILDKIRAEINKLTVYYTTKDKGINLISQNAVNRIFDKYKAESEAEGGQNDTGL